VVAKVVDIGSSSEKVASLEEKGTVAGISKRAGRVFQRPPFIRNSVAASTCNLVLARGMS
jgi:hypothetical protein